MPERETAWKAAVLGAVVVVACFALVAPAGASDTNFAYGAALYTRGDCKTALRYLGAAFQANPKDPAVSQYLSACYQRLGDTANAKKWSDYCQSLRRALAAVASPSGGTPQTAFTPTTTVRGQALAPSEGYLPDQCRIPFQKEGRLLFITAYLNNREVRMVFDTGAEMIALGQNQLDFRATDGPPIGAAGGVGSTGSVPLWCKYVTLKVGTIERRNCPIMVQQNMPTPPLLGQEFYKDYEYTIDYDSGDKERGTICFVKKGSRMASGGGNGNYSVPFKRHGNNLVVNVEVNGKNCEMFFDTGASGIAFTEDQLKAINVPIPEDAVPEMHGGIGGTTMAKGFHIARMRLGPIEKTDVPVSALQAANMRYPLLGQTFYGDWQYTIDTASNTIKFVRR